MSKKLDQVLELLSEIAGSGDGMTIDEMATFCGVSRRTAERMRDSINYSIIELKPEEDGNHKRWKISGKLGNWFTLPTALELAALSAEIESLKKANQPARAELLSSLLKKITSSLDQRARDRTSPDLEALANAQRVFVPAGPAVRVRPETISTIQHAIMANQMLEFKYQSDWQDEPIWRRVIPYGLVHGSINYLIAAIPNNKRGPHTYRLDRMTEVFLSDKYAAPPKDFNLENWMSQSFGMWQGEVSDIKLHVLPHAADKAKNWRFHSKQSITECEDGSVMVEFQAGGLRELAIHLCGWAGDLKIISPNELREEILEIQKAKF